MAQTQSVDQVKAAMPASLAPDLEWIPRDAAPAQENFATVAPGYSSSNLGSLELAADTEPALPSAPGLAASAANPERENVPYTAEWHQPPFSRIGIGADVSLLGFGIKPAIVLDEYLDARGLISFFGLTTGQFEVDGFKINANIHMASAAAAVDVYPYNSIWRLSAGLFFLNGNQISAATTIAPGTSFNLG